jgi:hypothetical protein
MSRAGHETSVRNGRYAARAPGVQTQLQYVQPLQGETQKRWQKNKGELMD